MLTRVADFLEPMLTQTPPDPFSMRPRQSLEARQARAGVPRARAGRSPNEAVEILTGAARPILDRWFESEELKATIATDAVIGAFAAAVAPGHRLRALPPRHGRVQRRSRRVGLRSRRHGDGLEQHRGGREEPRRRDPHQRRRRQDSRDGRRASGRGAEGRHRVPREAGRLRRRRQRHLHQADGREGPAGRLPRGGQADRLQLARR